MSAIWSSSERPISVRTVWVNGIRHAILSQDDPLLSAKAWQRRWRPRTSPVITVKDSKHPLKFESCLSEARDCADVSSFNNCLVKFHLVAEKGVAEEIRRDCLRGLLRRQSAPPCGRFYMSSSAGSSKAVKTAEQSDIQPGSTSACDVQVSAGPSRTQSNDSISSRVKQQPTSVTAVSPLDTLSERVLHWLDLSKSKKCCCLVPEDAPEPRHASHPHLERPVGIGGVQTSSCLFSCFRQEGSSMKLIVPTQCLVIQQTNSANNRSNNRCQRRELGQMLEPSRAQPNPQTHDRSQTMNTISLIPIKVNNRTIDHHTTSESLSTLPRKPQLHIFMPSFRPAHYQWMSSQDSLFCE